MKTLIAILSALLLPALAAAATVTPYDQSTAGPVDVDVWLDNADGAVYDYGQGLTIRFRTDADSYVAVYNVDSDGYLSLLYPRYGDSQWVQGGRVNSIPGPEDRYDLVIDGPKGIEYIVAVASPYPLRLGVLEPSNEYWYRSASVGGRISGDPSEAIWEINEQLTWDGEGRGPDGYASDVAWFYVRAVVPYPRYLVYQWYPDRYWDPFWDPYVSINLWVDWHWDHHWCHRRWWHWGHRPEYDFWYRDRHDGPRLRWKSVHYVVKPGDWDRDKPGRPPVAIREDHRGAKSDRRDDRPDRPQRWDRNDRRYEPGDRPSRKDDDDRRGDRPSRRDEDRDKRDDRPAQREDKPAVRPEKPESKPEAKPEPPRAEERRPESRPAAKPESKPASKPEERPSRKERGKPEAKPESRPGRR